MTRIIMINDISISREDNSNEYIIVSPGTVRTVDLIEAEQAEGHAAYVGKKAWKHQIARLNLMKEMYNGNNISK